MRRFREELAWGLAVVAAFALVLCLLPLLPFLLFVSLLGEEA